MHNPPVFYSDMTPEQQTAFRAKEAEDAKHLPWWLVKRPASHAMSFTGGRNSQVHDPLRLPIKTRIRGAR